jgi:hypothetical protein
MKEVVSSTWSTKVFAREQNKPKWGGSENEKDGWDPKIGLSVKNYLPSKFLYNPDPKTETKLNHVLIKNILSKLDKLSGQGKPSKFIMMCLLRPEVDSTFCTGARATLEFAKSVCSTCIIDKE